MMPLFLLDTDMCSYAIKGRHPALDSRLRSLSPHQIAISAVTRAELRFGMALRPEASRLAMLVESFLQTVATLPWDAPTADRYATVRAMLQQAGQPIGDHDTMIAAHALTVNATLITHNLAHFTRVNGLICADWA